ncbi:8428_t:CDS:1, partial [Ambispora gerdemannii]
MSTKEIGLRVSHAHDDMSSDISGMSDIRFIDQSSARGVIMAVVWEEKRITYI